MLTNFTADCFAFGNETKMIGMVRTAAASFSLFASIIVLVFLCVKRSWNKGHGQRLFLWFTITVVFEGPSSIMQTAIINYDAFTVYRPLCIFAGIYNQYSNWLINLAILWITFYLFRVYIINVFYTSGKRHRPRIRSRVTGTIILVLILVIPIPLSLIPLWGHKYGIVNAWCWIISHNQNNCSEIDKLGVIYQYSFWFVPFILEVILLSVLSIVIFLTFLHGYNKYRQQPIVQKEFYHRMQEFLPLLLSLSLYSLFCIFRVINFTTDIAVKRPMPIMWIVNIITGHMKEVLVMIGYLATLQIISYHVKKKNKEMGLGSEFKRKDYSTFEIITPRVQESESSLPYDIEVAT